MHTENIHTETQTTENSHHAHTLFAEEVFHIGPSDGGIPVTNSMLTSWLALALVVLVSVVLRLKLSKIPSKMQHIFEIVVEGALSVCDQVTNDRKLSEKIFPLAISIFFFMLFNNWLGILPGVGSIGFNEIKDGHETFVALFRGGTADVNTTLALGLFSVIGANIFGIVSIGLWKTFNKYVNLKALGYIFTKVRREPTILVVAPISFFVGVLEAIGEIAKVASLSFRLFGNVFAGEVLLASMSALVAYVVPAPFLLLEVFVGLIQIFP
jgi:F-type H+-transporting ATPase subunit a